LDLVNFGEDVDMGVGWRRMDLTVDSGAARSVGNGEDFPMIPLEGSEGSKIGQIFVGPGKERIPNRGQKHYRGKTKGSGILTNICLQDAPVRKPLAAVSGITDKDNVVLFDRKGSFIAPANNPEVEEIRRLIRKVKQRIELERSKGVYLMPFWVQVGEDEENRDAQASSVFTRQGK